jgi:hypothetical protein
VKAFMGYSALDARLTSFFPDERTSKLLEGIYFPIV